MKLSTASTAVLGSALALLTFNRRVSGQQSCVQTVDTTFSACPCNAAEFSFSIVGETSVANNTVNLAVVVDGSGSVGGVTDAWELEKEFAKNTTAAFADRNLFTNGGSASYVQFSNSALDEDSGTFYSLEEFESYVDDDDIRRQSTNIGAGIERARSLLNDTLPASAAFMIVVTDGDHTTRFLPLPKEQADAARAEGVEVFAVGVGGSSSVGEATLEEIGGNADRVFRAEDFQALSDVLNEILDSEGSAAIACEATDATLEVEFGLPIADVSYPAGASFSGNVATLPVGDITSDGTDFMVQLETCMLANDTIRVVTDVSYSDDQGNNPDFSSLLDVGEGKRCTTGPTLAPTTLAPTPSPTTTTHAATAPTTTTPPSAASMTSNPPDGGQEAYDCSVCLNLTKAQEEALAGYDNGGRKIVCDPTCLDGVSDPIYCNYFGLGQICRVCGNCSSCIPCPDGEAFLTSVPTASPSSMIEGGSLTSPPTREMPTTTPTSSPTPTVPADDDNGDDEYDCSVCLNLTEAQEEALASYGNRGKKIVCDPTCLDGVSNPAHCNYYGLGQICRGCGDCTSCTPCP